MYPGVFHSPAARNNVIEGIKSALGTSYSPDGKKFIIDSNVRRQAKHSKQVNVVSNINVSFYDEVQRLCSKELYTQDYKLQQGYR